MQGIVQLVTVRPGGGFPTSPSAVGSSSLSFADASDFEEDGGQVSIDGVVLDYVSADLDLDVVYLASPLSFAVDEGTFVANHPPTTETFASVALDDDIVEAEVPHSLKPLLPEGPRDPEDGEAVILEMDEQGFWSIKDVVGSRAAIDAAFIENADELLLEDMKTLGEKLSEAAAERAAAAGRLDAAEGLLGDAFDQIDVLPDQAYVDAAKQQAIDAAATDAQAKADAALTDAKAFATTQTDGVAKSVWSTALPGTTRLPQNSTWYQHDSAGKIIAVFNQTAATVEATHGNTWVARPIKSEAIDNLDLGKLTVAGDATLQQAVINSLVAQMASFVKADIGNLTVTGGSNLNTVVAERIWGNIASFAELTADKILAGFLQATIGIATGGAIVAGDPGGARVEMTSDGFRVWVIGPNSLPYVAVEMVNGKISFRVAGSDGSILASIGSDGSITGTRATFTKDPVIAGLPLMGQVGGGIVPGRMDILPRGVVPGSQARRTTPSAQRAVGSHHTFLQTKATLHPGRLYQFVGTGVATSGAVNGVVRWTARWTTDGTTPNTSSPEITNVTGPQTYSPTVNFAQNLISDLFTVNVKTQARFVMTYQSLNGATPTATSARCFIEDKGPVSTEALLADGDAPTLYVTEWKASASRIYTKTGAPLAGGDGKVQVWNWTPTNTNEATGVLFGGGADVADNASELGKTMPTALSGATILKSEVYLHSKINYTADNQPGPTALGTLGATTLPATKIIDGSLYVPEIASGGGAWVEVPTSWFAGGANLGITVGDKDGFISTPGGAAFLAAIIFHDINDANPPKVRHTYTR